MPNNVKGIKIHSVAKYEKTRRGTLWGHLKNFRKKVTQCRKKSKMGDPLGTSGFVGFLEKVKNERGTLWIKFALVGLGLRWFQDSF